jgi:arachidonate 15-lipoxygenase
MSALLPQNDPDRAKRDAQLQATRTKYAFNHTYLSPMAMLERVPEEEYFSVPYMIEVGGRALRVLANHIEVEGDPTAKSEMSDTHGFIYSAIQALSLDFKGLVRVIQEALSGTTHDGHYETLQGFADVFRTIDLPSIAGDYHDDRVFARMRVGGPNPVMLQRVSRLDDRFPMTDALFQRSLPGDTLAAAGAEGRLYLADYAFLEGVENGVFPSAPKYLYAPLALYALERATRQLVPVAIQIGQRPGPMNPIYTPPDGTAWTIAKNVVQVADGNYHQTITHLGRTHLFIEPFAIAAHRQLASNHPLALLLTPHFQFTLSINDVAYKYLVNDGGPVDELLAGTIEATRGLTAKGVATHRVDQAALPLALKARGVEDPSVFPDYPYRDDATLYWDAVSRWVTDYVSIYYPTDAEVVQDTELAAFVADVSSSDGGRIAGVPPIKTVAALADLATLVIFTASVQHAAVNFPQYDLMAYVPNMPLANFKVAPYTIADVTQADYLAILPPRRQTGLQMALGFLLGSLHYGSLGDYGRRYFSDDRVAAPLEAFQDRLAAIGKTIDERNKTRRAYPFLAASGIPQSINI